MTTTPIAPAAIAPSNEEIRAMLQPLLAKPSADLKVAAERLWNEAQDEACKHLHAGNELPADLIWRLQIHDWAAKAFAAPVLIRAALSRLSRAPAPAAQECPTGWQLVPVEPTEEMVAHAFHNWGRSASIADTYRQMLAVAPAHQAAAEPAPERPAKEVCQRCGGTKIDPEAYGHNPREKSACLVCGTGRPSPEPSADEPRPASGAYSLSYVGVVPQKPAPEAMVRPDAATQCTCNPRNSNYLVDHHDLNCDYVRACEDSLEQHPILHPRYRRAVAPAPEAMVERVADAIDAARYAHPDHPRERDRSFSNADRRDREYATRLARAAIAAATLLSSQNGVDRATIIKCHDHLIDKSAQAERHKWNAAAIGYRASAAALRALLPVETEGKS